ncbi:MAG: hypothetical protein C4334_15160 [Pyrinomonas sp.]
MGKAHARYVFRSTSEWSASKSKSAVGEGARARFDGRARVTQEALHLRKALATATTPRGLCMAERFAAIFRRLIWYGSWIKEAFPKTNQSMFWLMVLSTPSGFINAQRFRGRSGHKSFPETVRQGTG